ncbi:MAG TPA: DUF5312 family protein [Spirochaetota bacterium]|nr:DUF5312 family protein [Spirochaetota bacterium]
MSYDEESIRKAKDKGIFNDSFDPLALGLSEDEKKRMAKGFEGAQRDLMNKAEASDNKSGKKRGKQGQQDVKKAGFFERLVRFFVMLFTGLSPADYEKKKRIKELKLAIKKLKPAVYNFQTEAITAEFAGLIHDFFKLVWPYRIVFEEVFGETDPESHLDFQLFYVRTLVPTITDEEIFRFTEDGIKEYVKGDRDSMVRKRIDEMTDIFIRKIDEETRRRLNRTFADFINVKELLSYNFFSFLKRFQSGYSVDDPNPDFHDIRPDGTGEMLKDLESILLAVNTKALPSVLGLAAAYFQENGSKTADEETVAKTLVHFQKMAEGGYRMIPASLSKIVNGQQLCLLIRYITKNLEYEAHIYPRGTNFFEEFGRGLVAAMEARVSRVLARRKQEEVDAKLKELFETQEQMPDYLYSEATNGILRKLDLPDFIYPTAFYVSMRYFSEKYYQYIKRVLNKLIVDGSFKDSLARRTLADEFYKMDDLFNRLIVFSNSVNIRKEKGSLFQSMLQKFKGDLASKKALGARIATINQELHAVLQDIRDCTVNLQTVLVRIGHDIDSEKPEIVDNLHKIGAAGNVRFLGEMKRSIRESVLFSDIILKVFKDT